MRMPITDLLKQVKLGDDEATVQIIEIFKPLIKAKARKSGWGIDHEDIESILTIKLIETIRTMPYQEDDGKNVNYIAVTLRNHFLTVIKKINKLEEKEILSVEMTEEASEKDYDDLVFKDMIKGFSDKKQEILTLKYCKMYTDQEIADELGVSRQCVNKHLRESYGQILKDYLNNTPRIRGDGNGKSNY